MAAADQATTREFEAESATITGVYGRRALRYVDNPGFGGFGGHWQHFCQWDRWEAGGEVIASSLGLVGNGFGWEPLWSDLAVGAD